MRWPQLRGGERLGVCWGLAEATSRRTNAGRACSLPGNRRSQWAAPERGGVEWAAAEASGERRAGLTGRAGGCAEPLRAAAGAGPRAAGGVRRSRCRDGERRDCDAQPGRAPGWTWAQAPGRARRGRCSGWRALLLAACSGKCEVGAGEPPRPCGVRRGHARGPLRPARARRLLRGCRRT